MIYFFGRVYEVSVGAGAAARGTLKTSLNIKTDERKGQGAERREKGVQSRGKRAGKLTKSILACLEVNNGWQNQMKG